MLQICKLPPAAETGEIFRGDGESGAGKADGGSSGVGVGKDALDLFGKSPHAVAFVADVKRLGKIEVSAGTGIGQSSQESCQGDAGRKEAKPGTLTD